MWLLAVNKQSREIRYYYGSTPFDVPHDVEGWNIYVFDKPPLRREFCVKDGKPIEQISLLLYNVSTTEDIGKIEQPSVQYYMDM